jgi:tetratricopeptide (TPR) repeat protein
MKSALHAMVSRSILRVCIPLSLCGICAAIPAQSQDAEVTPQVQQLYAQAQAAQQRDDIPGAIQKYREMIRLAPHLAAAYNNLGRLYFNQHDYGHAAQTLAQGLRLNPDMPTASAMLGPRSARIRKMPWCSLHWRRFVSTFINTMEPSIC